MSTSDKVQTSQETWRDWLGPGDPEPDEFFSRAEIVERTDRMLRPGMKPVKAGDLRLWEQLGILPRGIRRGHQGAARNIYPEWTAHLAQQVRLLQKQGYSLEEIKPRVRAYARMILGYGRTSIDDEIKASNPHAQAPEDISLWTDLINELERLARWRAHLTGVETDRVEVRVIGTDNHGTIFPYPIATHDESNT